MIPAETRLEIRRPPVPPLSAEIAIFPVSCSESDRASERRLRRRSVPFSTSSGAGECWFPCPTVRMERGEQSPLTYTSGRVVTTCLDNVPAQEDNHGGRGGIDMCDQDHFDDDRQEYDARGLV